MTKWYWVGLATLLVGARCAFGQAAGSAPAPALEPVQVLSVADGVADGHNTALVSETCPERHGVFALDAEYALWFVSSSRAFPAIAATGPLGQPGSLQLEGARDAEHVRSNPGSGGRFAVGYWLIEDNPWVPGGIRDLGAEARFFFVGQRSGDFQTGSEPILVRPFFDLNLGQEAGFVVAAPGLASGSIFAHAQLSLWGAEANVWKNIYYNYPGTTLSVSLLAGFRYLSLDQRLELGSLSVFNQDLSSFTDFLPFAGNTLLVQDSFVTHNRFYGGQVGLTGTCWPLDCVRLEGTVKLGLGVTREELNIVGSQVRTFPNGTTVSSVGGLFALPSNIGHHERNKFTQVPELGLRLAVPVLDHLTVSGGISALYWSRLIRPGLQIDRQIDVSQLPNLPGATSPATPTGLARPSVPFNESDLWLLGVNIGVEVSW
jgi:hypothetical protein